MQLTIKVNHLSRLQREEREILTAQSARRAALTAYDSMREMTYVLRTHTGQSFAKHTHADTCTYYVYVIRVHSSVTVNILRLGVQCSALARK